MKVQFPRPFTCSPPVSNRDINLSAPPSLVDDDGNGEEEQSISGLTQEEGGSFLAELTLHGGEPAYSMALHPRGNLVASAGGNDHAALFELSLASEEALSDGSGELLRVNLLADLSGHGDTVEHVQFSADGALLATGSLDGTVRIYSEETRTWTLKHILEGPTEVTVPLPYYMHMDLTSD